MILKQKKIKIYRRILPILLLVIVSGSLLSCKDESAVNDSGKLETCRLYLDRSEWNSAVAACKDLESDEGRHLSALAYMGRSGFTISSLMLDLSESSGSATNLLYEKIPDTDAKKNDFKKALYKIMGEITNKTPTMYFEAVLLSSLIVFKELKTLLGLQIVNGAIQTCAGASGSTDISNCSFAPTITTGPDTLHFSGLGSTFYKGVCGSIEADTTDDANVGTSKDTTTQFTDGVTITYDVTVDSCTVSEKSVLYYNKISSTEYGKSGKLDLSVLNFYTKMDMGGNFVVTPNTVPISFCNDGQIAVPDASDDKLNDCEILEYLKNPGF